MLVMPGWYSFCLAVLAGHCVNNVDINVNTNSFGFDPVQSINTCHNIVLEEL